MQAAGRRLARQNNCLVKPQTNKFSQLYADRNPPLSMVDEESQHRIKLPLYDLFPYIENCWVAPNSTVVGEVYMHRFASVWYNSVIRGDINRVE